MKTAVVAGALCTLLLGFANAWAVDNTPDLPDARLQQRYEGLIHELRCVQCQNEAIADSTVNLAADLRLRVHDLILAGKSDDEIRDYMVARYGDFILLRPRMTARTAWLWAAPGLLLLGGAFVAVSVLRRRSQLPIEDDPRD
ncbi:MAG TPA: cytochrome c-type biogenesis protein [Steroidobacteraceae bacterium]|nr:cytochrome c-type biogenesis protein [Steroidobacteraceae bacterium]